MPINQWLILPVFQSDSSAVFKQRLVRFRLTNKDKICLNSYDQKIKQVHWRVWKHCSMVATNCKLIIFWSSNIMLVIFRINYIFNETSVKQWNMSEIISSFCFVCCLFYFTLLISATNNQLITVTLTLFIFPYGYLSCTSLSKRSTRFNEQSVFIHTSSSSFLYPYYVPHLIHT